MDSVLSLIGLMYRAGKLEFGESVLENISKIKFIFIASDASVKTAQRYLKKCDYYHIEHSDAYSGSDLSKATGKKNVKIIGLTDEGFKKALLKKIKEAANGETDIQKTRE